MIYGLLSERNFPARKLRGEHNKACINRRTVRVAEFSEFLSRVTIMIPPNPGHKFRCVPSRDPRAQYHLKCNDIYFLHYHNCDSTGHTHLSYCICEGIFDGTRSYGLPETKRKGSKFIFCQVFLRIAERSIYVYISSLKFFCAPIYRKNIAPLVDLHFTTFETSEPYIKTTILGITGLLTSFFISPHKHREKLCVKNNKRESTAHTQSVCDVLYLEISPDRKHTRNPLIFLFFILFLIRKTLSR